MDRRNSLPYEGTFIFPLGYLANFTRPNYVDDVVTIEALEHTSLRC